MKSPTSANGPTYVPAISETRYRAGYIRHLRRDFLSRVAVLRTRRRGRDEGHRGAEAQRRRRVCHDIQERRTVEATALERATKAEIFEQPRRKPTVNSSTIVDRATRTLSSTV